MHRYVYGPAMPNKTIYVSDDDMKHWNAVQEIAKRRKVSLSKIIGSCLADFTRTHDIAASSGLGLPVGMRIPASMKDPKLVEQEALADDFRAQFLTWLQERET